MKVAFYHSDKPRERLLAQAFLEGAKRHGHETFAVRLGDEPDPGTFDAICILGVKSNDRWRANRLEGCHLIMIDKGYSRGTPVSGNAARWEYFRVAVNAHQPTRYLMNDTYPDDRWARLGVEIQPWRNDGESVIIAGSSEKYHAFYGMKSPTAYVQHVVKMLRGITNRPLIYRPKPSWQDAVPVKKAGYSRHPQKIWDLLPGSWALVTHGSNACFEAMIMGIPSIILGDGVMKPISSTRMEDVDNPMLASNEDRLKIARALAYCQFRHAEFSSGLAWDHIERHFND